MGAEVKKGRGREMEKRPFLCVPFCLQSELPLS